jgi:hypothetical protein
MVSGRKEEEEKETGRNNSYLSARKGPANIGYFPKYIG